MEQVVEKNRVPWLVTTPTRLRAAGEFLDGRRHIAPTQQAALEDELQRMEGNVLHAIALEDKIWSSIRPLSLRCQSDEYRERLSHIAEFLPTSPPAMVRAVRRNLDRPELVLQRRDNSAAEEACLEIIAESQLAAAETQAPVVGSYPLFDEPVNDRAFADPSALQTEWRSRSLPKLRAEKIPALRAWERSQPQQSVGLDIFYLTGGKSAQGLPEATALIIAPALRLTLLTRMDRLTDLTDRFGGRHLSITDTKSGEHVHLPPEGSVAEVAERAVQFLTIMAFLSAARRYRLGYPLECWGPWDENHPPVLSETDDVAIRYVAFAHQPPEEIDFCERFGQGWHDPAGSRRQLEETRGFLAQIHQDSAAASIVHVHRRKK